MKFKIAFALRLGIPAALGVLVMSLATILSIALTIPEWLNPVEDYLLAEERAALQRRAAVLANVTVATFDRVSLDLSIAHDYAAAVFRGDFDVVRTYPSYQSVPFFANGVLPPGGLVNDRNTKYALWYSPATTNVSEEVVLPNASLLDNVWRSMFVAAGSRYLGLIFGGPSGVFRHLPFAQSDNFRTMRYTCVADGLPRVGFDSRCRSWYVLAMHASNADAIAGVAQIGTPYIDVLTSATLVTISRRIVLGSSASQASSSASPGVLAVDLDMTLLEATILEQRVLREGYSVLLQVDGSIVVHPGMGRSRVYTVADGPMFASRAEGQLFNRTVLQPAVATPGTVVQADVTKGGATWVATCIALSGKPLVACNVVPVGDVTQTTDDLRDTAGAGITAATTTLIILGCITVVVAFVVLSAVASAVGAPLDELTDVLRGVSQGETDITMPAKEPEILELQRIYDTFDDLLLAVKFGNTKLTPATARTVVDSYARLVVLLRDRGGTNPRGLAAAYSNLGFAVSAYPQQFEKYQWAPDTFTRAHGHPRSALDAAEFALRDCLHLTPVPDPRTTHHVDRGDFALYVHRTLKLIDVLCTRGRYVSAEQLLEEVDAAVAARYTAATSSMDACDDPSSAVALDSRESALEAQKLEVRLAGQRAMVSLSKGLPEEAKEEARKLWSGRVSEFTDSPSDTTAALAQRAGVEAARVFYKAATASSGAMDDEEERKQIASRSLALWPRIEPSTREQLLMMRDAVKQVMRAVHFVLDTSGSMSQHGRIETCRESILSIVNDTLSNDDSVSLTTFNSHVHTAHRLANLGECRNTFCGAVHGETNPHGRTAFYSAVVRAIEDAAESSRGDVLSHWVVALTDGEDNKSTHSVEDTYHSLQRADVNFVVIAVGKLQNLTEIQRMAQACRQTGLFIPADDANGIRSAFAQAAAAMAMGSQEIL